MANIDLILTNLWISRIFNFKTEVLQYIAFNELPLYSRSISELVLHIFLINNTFSFLDNSIPTVGLDIPNTEAGHCLKTMTIFRKILSEIKDGKKKFIKWIILADDDTILRY